jgi:hypothetical protein
MKLDLEANKAATLSRWISRQHDGALSFDLRQNYSKFCRFVEYVANNLENTIRKVISIVQQTELTRTNEFECRNSSLELFVTLITKAMEHATVSKVGRIQWVANAITSDLEEFVVDPFGSVDRFGIPMGIYSQLGHEMVNRAEQTNLSYEETLRKIVEYIFRETNEDFKNIGLPEIRRTGFEHC